MTLRRLSDDLHTTREILTALPWVDAVRQPYLDWPFPGRSAAAAARAGREHASVVRRFRDGRRLFEDVSADESFLSSMVSAGNTAATELYAAVEEPSSAAPSRQFARDPSGR
jgi:hypothetical protein